MLSCQWLVNGSKTCGKMCEGKNALCASHARLARKIVTDGENLAKKRDLSLAKAKIKNSKPRPIIAKVSDKRKELNERYSQMRTDFLRMTKECEAKVNEYCTNKPETIHHKKGRGKYLLAPETWIPCCMSCHVYIEAHPKEAKEKGWSDSRLAKEEPKI